MQVHRLPEAYLGSVLSFAHVWIASLPYSEPSPSPRKRLQFPSSVAQLVYRQATSDNPPSGRIESKKNGGEEPRRSADPSVERGYHWTLLPIMNHWPCQSLLDDMPVAPVI